MRPERFKAWIPTQEQLELTEKLAGEGYSQLKIAEAIQCPIATFRHHLGKKSGGPLQDAYRKGFEYSRANDTQDIVRRQPKWVPPPDASERITKFAGEGLTSPEIARQMGTSQRVFEEVLSQQPPLMQALEDGTNDFHAHVMRRLKDHIDHPDPKISLTACIYTLKARKGMFDMPKHGQSDMPTGPQAKLAVPKPATVLNFQNTVDKELRRAEKIQLAQANKKNKNAN